MVTWKAARWSSAQPYMGAIGCLVCLHVCLLSLLHFLSLRHVWERKGEMKRLNLEASHNHNLTFTG
jgi:hypothetical protein